MLIFLDTINPKEFKVIISLKYLSSMSALKLVAFLFLALAVVSLNLKSSHNEQLKTVTFKVTNTYSLPVADQYVWSDFPGLAGEFIVG